MSGMEWIDRMRRERHFWVRGKSKECFGKKDNRVWCSWDEEKSHGERRTDFWCIKVNNTYTEYRLCNFTFPLTATRPRNYTFCTDMRQWLQCQQYNTYLLVVSVLLEWVEKPEAVLGVASMCNTVEQRIIIFIHAFKVSIFCFDLFKFELCSLIPTFTMILFQE